MFPAQALEKGAWNGAGAPQQRDAMLTIDVHSASGLPKKGMGKQDPFLIVKYAGHQLKSTICYDGGSNPVWDDKFHFKEAFDCDAPEILVKDLTFLSDILIGVAKVPLESALADRCVATMNVPIKDAKRGFETGSLTVNVSITPVQHVSPHDLRKLPFAFSPKERERIKHTALMLKSGLDNTSPYSYAAGRNVDRPGGDRFFS